MIGFGVAGLVLLAAALLPVVLALRTQRDTDGTDPRLAAYRARLEEIGNEARDGLIAADQADSARREIERELLAHVGATAAAGGTAGRPHAATALIVVLSTGVLALGLYLHGGRPDLVGADTTVMQSADVEAMIGKITDHLRQNPGDAQGWEMLGRAYMAMGRHAEAVPAFERLLALKGEDDPGALVRYADALAMAAGGTLAGKPTELLARALALEPENRTALWLSGMAAVERGDNAGAVALWNRLLPLLQDPDTKSEVTRLIERAGGTVTAATPVAANAVAIRVRVDIAQELAAGVPDDAVIFITARATQGPPMPLAVLRRAAADLPLDVTLDDTLAMTPDLRLSQHTSVTITARVSVTGRAERETGDLIGEVADVPTAGTEPVTVVIGARVP